MSNTPGETIRGRHAPGLQSPDLETSGSQTPGSASPQSAEATVAADATGVEQLGDLDGDRVVIRSVVVDSTDEDYDFQVTLDGSDVFAGAQSPTAAGVQTFTPNSANAASIGTDGHALTFEVTAASASAGASADVTVNYTVEESY